MVSYTVTFHRGGMDVLQYRHASESISLSLLSPLSFSFQYKTRNYDYLKAPRSRQ